MTNSHFVNGMKALYTVTSSCGSEPEPPKYTPEDLRVYYVGTVEIEWEYTPGKIDRIYNESLLDEDR